jgi:8-oxo-dGTP pyrophosphatase MutT (NUDIX family)
VAVLGELNERDPRRSAGLVLVRETGDGARFLLLRDVRDWVLPKGRVAQRETTLAAAQRATCEQTGINAFEFPWGEGYVDTEADTGGTSTRYHLARTSSEGVQRPIDSGCGRAADAHYRWADLDEAFSLARQEFRPVIAWAAGIIMTTARLA